MLCECRKTSAVEARRLCRVMRRSRFAEDGDPMAKQNSTRTAPKAPSTVAARKASETATTARPAASSSRGGAAATTGRSRPAAPSRLDNLKRGFRDTVTELRKVQWPDKMTTRNLTLIVVAMSTVLAVVLGAFDYVLTLLVEWLIGL